MVVETIEAPGAAKLHCMRCGHEWFPKDPTKKPRRCPNKRCNSPYWDKARTKDTRTQVECLRCHHTWLPRTDETPTMCPSCKRTNWNEPIETKNPVSPAPSAAKEPEHKVRKDRRGKSKR